MGSGSSKSAAKAPSKDIKQPPKKPVANVNKDEPVESKTNSVIAKHGVDGPLKLESNLHLSGPIAPIQTNRSTVDTGKDNEKSKSKKEKSESKTESNAGPKSSRLTNNNPTALQFEDDSDVDDDIDAVLKIPMANEPSKQMKGKDKKSKRDMDSDKENMDNRQTYNDDNYHGYNGQNINHYPPQENDSLPETYAQRLQRQQYKLQQGMLIREKTSIRNMRDWRREDDDSENEENVTPRGGFDASKFRAANKGGETKADLFSTVKDDLETPRYLQSSGQDIEEVDVNKREHESGHHRLPAYNQSEIDLMRQLEQEMML